MSRQIKADDNRARFSRNQQNSEKFDSAPPFVTTRPLKYNERVINGPHKNEVKMSRRSCQ